MNSARDIKLRIKNVGSIKQMVRALYMIASTKLNKARAQLEGIRPIYYELKGIVDKLSSQEGAKNHPFYAEREVKNSLYIVFTADRGFAGAYNANIMAKALEHMNMNQEKKQKILVVGSKGYEYFKKRNMNIVRAITDVSDAQTYQNAESISKLIIDLYLSGEVDEIFVAYTQFDTLLSYLPRVDKLLPVAADRIEMDGNNDIKYEPDIDTFIDHAIPFYLHMSLFRAFLESNTSEQAARMINMDSAEKNAEEMIEDLTRLYNRQRQASITQELSEIVGGANILNKGELYDS